MKQEEILRKQHEKLLERLGLKTEYVYCMSDEQIDKIFHTAYMIENIEKENHRIAFYDPYKIGISLSNPEVTYRKHREKLLVQEKEEIMPKQEEDVHVVKDE